MTSLTALPSSLNPGELKARIERSLTTISQASEAIQADLELLAKIASAPASGDGPLTPRLLSIQQTADLLGRGRSTVESLIRTGQLGSRKIGASRRVPSEEIDNYVHSLPGQRRIGA